MKFPAPTLTVPTLATWQFSFNGFTFGNATPAAVLKVTGLGDNPHIRSSTPTRARDHGQLVGLDLYGGRTFTINVWAQPNATSLQTNLLKLAAACEVGLATEQPLWFKQPNLPVLCVMCRPRKKTVPWDLNYGAAMVAKPVVQFHATSPLVFGKGRSLTVGVPGPLPGMTFPSAGATFPLSFGGAVKPAGVTADHTGNAPMKPVLVITGPVTTPSLSNDSLPGAPLMTIRNPTQTGYTVTPGDQLVIDMDAHSVEYYVGGVASGSAPASRLSWVVAGSTWWYFQPGPNLVHLVSEDSTTLTGTFQVQWADAYIL